MRTGQLVSWAMLIPLLLLTPFTPVSAEISVRHAQGLLTVSIDEAPLGQALAEVARQLGAELTVRGELGDVSEVALTEVPVEVALRRMVAPHGLLLRLAPKQADGTRRIRAIHVYQQTPPEQRSQSLQPTPPSTASEDADEREIIMRIRELLDDGDDAAVAELSQLATGSESASVRRLSVTALSRIGSAPAVEAIELAVGDADPAVRLQAARGLAAVLGDEAIDQLESMAASETDESIRTALNQLIERL